jgi:CheY-like chemotaxis protein
MMTQGVVLLADDNATDAELAIRALGIGGVPEDQIEWVQDGEAALHYVFRQGRYEQRPAGNPRLLLLDLHMPKVDGIDVLRQIKADPRTRATPVVIMSSSDQASDLVRTYELYANSFVVKPVDFHEFTDCVSLIGQYWTRVNRALR